MSEKNDRRRNKKYSDSKRQTILKKDDGHQQKSSTSEISSQPKLLLRAREKPTPDVQPTPPPQINIAVREKDSTQTNQPQRPTVTRETPAVAPVTIEQAPIRIPLMTKPIDLVTPNQLINTQAFDFLNDNNSLFLVVGVIGMRSVGKSTILNLLMATDDQDSLEEKLFLRKNGTFPIRDYISSSAINEGIQMFVTKDRTILLDCSPLLANLHKKDCVVNEMEDLKLIMFMLNVCHLLIIVQEDYFNTNLIRLIQNAELMKSKISKDEDHEYNANLMFVKNHANRMDFTEKSRETLSKMIKLFFKNSSLRIFPGNYTPKELKTELNVNTFEFPHVNIDKSKRPYFGHPQITNLINEFRQKVFMSRRNSMINIPAPFTEKFWSELVLKVWKTNKGNFFLRKFETLKEKTGLHGSDTNQTNSKDRGFYDFC